MTGERISRKGWAGIVAVFLGSVIITLGGARGGSDPLRGDLLALVGAFFVACYTMLGKSAAVVCPQPCIPRLSMLQGP